MPPTPDQRAEAIAVIAALAPLLPPLEPNDDFPIFDELGELYEACGVLVPPAKTLRGTKFLIRHAAEVRAGQYSPATLANKMVDNARGARWARGDESRFHPILVDSFETLPIDTPAAIDQEAARERFAVDFTNWLNGQVGWVQSPAAAQAISDAALVAVDMAHAYPRGHRNSGYAEDPLRALRQDRNSGNSQRTLNARLAQTIADPAQRRALGRLMVGTAKRPYGAIVAYADHLVCLKKGEEAPAFRSDDLDRWRADCQRADPALTGSRARLLARVRSDAFRAEPTAFSHAV